MSGSSWDVKCIIKMIKVFPFLHFWHKFALLESLCQILHLKRKNISIASLTFRKKVALTIFPFCILFITQLYNVWKQYKSLMWNYPGPAAGVRGSIIHRKLGQTNCPNTNKRGIIKVEIREHLVFRTINLLLTFLCNSDTSCSEFCKQVHYLLIQSTPLPSSPSFLPPLSLPPW